MLLLRYTQLFCDLVTLVSCGTISLFVNELSLKAEIILLTTIFIVKLESPVHTTDGAK